MRCCTSIQASFRTRILQEIKQQPPKPLRRRQPKRLFVSTIRINDKWQILGHYLHDSQATGTADADLGWNWETYNTVTSVESNPANSAAIKLTGELSPDVLD